MANIQKELKRFFESVEGEELIGNIVIKAVNQALCRDMLFEDGKSERGRTIEKTKRVDVLDEILKYLSYTEGAIRGCQSDSAKARNHSVEAVNMIGNMINAINNNRLQHDEKKQINVG